MRVCSKKFALEKWKRFPFPGHQILNIIKVSCLLNKVTELKAALIVLHNSNSVSFILTQHSQIPALIRKSYNFGGTKLRFQ